MLTDFISALKKTCFTKVVKKTLNFSISHNLLIEEKTSYLSEGS